MALRHYGGSVPSAGPLEWSCPACAHVNHVPLKAGCQQCGAKDGAGARKVEEVQERPAPQPATISTGAGAPPRGQAFQDWAKTVEHLQTPSVWALLEEAFMAGVAWAQGQQARPLPPAVTQPVTAVGEAPQGVQEYLYLTEQGALTDTSLEQPTLQTILAALAFYRDNVLNYGAVPGQLDAAGVTGLLARLSPQEPEGEA